MKQYQPISEGVRVLRVIEARIERRGRGIEESPIRIITQYFSLDGQLLAECDPCADIRTPEHKLNDENMERALRGR